MSAGALIGAICPTLVIGWACTRFLSAFVARGTRAHMLARTIYYEGRPFVLPLVLVDAALDIAQKGFTLDAHVSSGIYVVVYAWMLWDDYHSDDDDDDRWSRRGRAIRDRLRVGTRQPLRARA